MTADDLDLARSWIGGALNRRLSPVADAIASRGWDGNEERLSSLIAGGIHVAGIARYTAS